MRPDVDMRAEQARRELVAILQHAHAGELGAALAYAGHWRSLRRPDEIKEIQTIEREELDHRRRVHEMLIALDAAPDPALERLMRAIGTVIGWLCRIGGWFVPMYGAGCLERSNVQEYEDAARFAVLADESRFALDLLNMAEVEWEHERYFREKVESHWLAGLVPLWVTPPPLEQLWESFDHFLFLRSSLERHRDAA